MIVLQLKVSFDWGFLTKQSEAERWHCWACWTKQESSGNALELRWLELLTSSSSPSQIGWVGSDGNSLYQRHQPLPPPPLPPLPPPPSLSLSLSLSLPLSFSFSFSLSLSLSLFLSLSLWVPSITKLSLGGQQSSEKKKKEKKRKRKKRKRRKRKCHVVRWFEIPGGKGEGRFVCTSVHWCSRHRPLPFPFESLFSFMPRPGREDFPMLSSEHAPTILSPL